MGRTVDRLEGLAVLGDASVGALRFPTPGLLDSRSGSEVGPGPSVRHEPGPTGSREYTLSDGAGSLRLKVPVLAPEVVAGGPSVHPIADGSWYVHAPATSAELEGLKTRRPELLVLGNAHVLWEQGEPFVTALRDLRTHVGAGPVLWAPRVALPHRVPLLAYLGVDLADTVDGRLAAHRGTFLDASLGPVDRTAVIREELCDCASCRGGPDDADLHVRAQFRRALAETRAALRAGRLRELVEARTVVEPTMGEMLRHADRGAASLIETRAPVSFRGVRPYVLAESHRRPEMARFRARLLERYRPPPSKSVLLLVPCSRTKPYRLSRSHRRFARALEGLPSLERLHVVSVSSPIGLVPREMEDVPPARHYDIPVTGDWSEPERAAVVAALAHLLDHGSYAAVIVHLDRDEYGFLGTHLPDRFPTVWTVPAGRATAPEALDALRASVASALAATAPVEGGPLAVVREELKEVAAYQFGRGAAERLFAAPVKLHGRPWFQRLTDGRGDLAIWQEERGLFHLTVRGAERFAPEYPLAVTIDAGLALRGDLFVPGVRSAEAGIRTGDAVVLVRDGRVAGVGEAVLPGPLMTEVGRGVAVRVRHRAHGETDTPKTHDSPRDDRGPVV